MGNPNNTKIKIGLLGGGMNSAVGVAHLSAIHINSRFELVAGCFSRNPEQNAIAAEKYGVGKSSIYENLESMLQQPGLEAIHILTPTSQHKDQVIQCISAGVPVVCEKALGNNVQELSEIQEILDSKGGYLSVIYNYLGYPMLRELKQMIADDKLGDLQQIQIEMPQEGFLKRNAEDKAASPQTWRLKDGFVPTVSLDLGVHLHMMIKYITEKVPLEAVASYQTLGNFHEIIDTVSCMIQYSDNMMCNMWYTKTALGNRNALKIRVFGNKGAAVWSHLDPEVLQFTDIHGNSRVLDRGCSDVTVCNLPRYNRFKAGHPAGFIEAFANYYEDIADSLMHYKANGKQNTNGDCFGLAESMEGLQLFEALSRSVQSKKWEKVLQ